MTDHDIKNERTAPPSVVETLAARCQPGTRLADCVCLACAPVLSREEANDIHSSVWFGAGHEWDADEEAAHAVAVAQHARDVEAVRAIPSGVLSLAIRNAGPGRIADTAGAEAVRAAILDALEGR